MTLQNHLQVDDSSAIAEARRRALAIAEPLSFGEVAAGRLALAVTEIATNLIRHASGGEILMRPLTDGVQAGVEVLAFDKGPGIANLPQSMRDGISTRNTPGLGLGSISRLTSGFEVFTRAGAGTAARFESWPDENAPRTVPLIEVGAVSVAKPGQIVCGDAWAYHGSKGRHEVIVADGLGHGPEAATASNGACDAALGAFAKPPLDQIAEIHAALRPTRGAAAALAVLDPVNEIGVFCGVGNIAAATHFEGKSRSLVSQNGTLGHQLRKSQEFQFPFISGALLVLHSDGLSMHWDLGAYPGLAQRHPALIAAVLYRDFRRGTDDATVVVARHRKQATTS